MFSVLHQSVQPLSDQYLLPSQRLYIVCKIPHTAKVEQNCSCTNYPLGEELLLRGCDGYPNLPVHLLPLLLQDPGPVHHLAYSLLKQSLLLPQLPHQAFRLGLNDLHHEKCSNQKIEKLGRWYKSRTQKQFYLNLELYKMHDQHKT